MKLIIIAEKIEDRIKEQNLAERRAWTAGCYGFDKRGYYVEYSRKRKLRSKK